MALNVTSNRSQVSLISIGIVLAVFTVAAQPLYGMIASRVSYAAPETGIDRAPDTEKPSVTITTPATPIFSSSTTLTIQATDTVGVAKIVGNIYRNETLLKSTTTAVSPAATAAQHTIDLGKVLQGAPLAEGTYSLRYNALDSSGNISATRSYGFTIDNTTPTASFSFSNSNGNALTRDDVVVTMTASEAVKAPDGWTQVTPAQYTRTYSANGKQSIRLTDLAGNQSPELRFEIKRIDRGAPVIAGIADGAVVNVASVELIVTDPKFEGYDGFDALHGLSINGGTVATTYNATDKSYRITLQDEGTYTATATDKAGNVTTRSFRIDRSAPVITTTIAQDAFLRGTTGVQLITADEVNPAIVNIRLLRHDGTSVAGTGLYSTTAGTVTTWQFDTSAVADGRYRLQFSARDKAGNPAQTVYRDITIDNTAPEATITRADKYGAEGVSSDPSAVVWVSINGGEPVALGSDYITEKDGVYYWSLTFTSELEGGDYTVDVYAQDPAGNVTPEVQRARYLFTVTPASSEEPGETTTGTGGTIIDDGTISHVSGGAPIQLIETASLAAVSRTFSSSVAAQQRSAAIGITPNTPSVTSGDTDTSVLGAQIDKSGASATKLAATNQGWKLFGLLWYW